MTTFLTSDPLVGYFLAGSLVVVLVRLIRFGWSRWLDHEQAKERQRFMRIAQMNSESRDHVRGADETYAPPAFGSHRQPWKSHRKDVA